MNTLTEKFRDLCDAADIKGSSPDEMMRRNAAQIELPNFLVDHARDFLAGLEKLHKLESLVARFKEALSILADAPDWKPAQERVDDSMKGLFSFNQHTNISREERSLVKNS